MIGDEPVRRRSGYAVYNVDGELLAVPEEARTGDDDGGGPVPGVSGNALGTASNPVTDPDADRPTGLTAVWWRTETIPTNAIAGDYVITV